LGPIAPAAWDVGAGLTIESYTAMSRSADRAML
jgi:hypothetical protein